MPLKMMAPAFAPKRSATSISTWSIDGLYGDMPSSAESFTLPSESTWMRSVSGTTRPVMWPIRTLATLRRWSNGTLPVSISYRMQPSAY